MTSTSGVVFKTEFAVELHCEACVKTVKDALSRQAGVETYEISLKDQRVVVEGHAAPSQIARALKQDGRQVIVRGTGTMSSSDNHDNENDGAAVCIFEAYTPAPQDAHKTQELHGLARMVQVGKTTILDLTIKHEGLAKLAQQKGTSSFDIQTTTSSALGTVSPSQNTNSDTNTNNDVVANGAGCGDSSNSQASQHASSSKYGVFVAKTGDISDGAASTGGVLRELGQLELRKKDGYGDLFTEFQDFNIWDHIGRAMVIAPVLESSTQDRKEASQLGPGILAGVIARSAGAWSNDKSVCTCSGKTQWEEARTSKF